MSGMSSSRAIPAVSLYEYLCQRGLSFPICDYMLDKTRLPHGESERQRKRRILEGERAAEEYAERRNAAIQEYRAAVRRGELRPKSRIEELLAAANGHEDNQKTWAARRVLAKRGIDWRTSEIGGEINEQRKL